MSAPKHTGGPWERLPGIVEAGHPTYDEGSLVIRIVQKRAPGQSDFVKVALVDAGPVDANARLIAAAPDGLAFATALDASWTETFPDGPETAGEGILRMGEEHRQLWLQCRAFIAKATGEGA